MTIHMGIYKYFQKPQHEYQSGVNSDPPLRWHIYTSGLLSGIDVSFGSLLRPALKTFVAFPERFPGENCIFFCSDLLGVTPRLLLLLLLGRLLRCFFPAFEIVSMWVFFSVFYNWTVPKRRLASLRAAPCLPPGPGNGLQTQRAPQWRGAGLHRCL